MISYLAIVLVPILLSLVIGWFIGARLNENTKSYFVSSISYLVWFLLVSIGFQFGEVLFNYTVGKQILIESFLYSTLISILTYGFLLKNVFSDRKIRSNRISDILKPIIECVVAISMVILGIIIHLILPKDISSVYLSDILLYLLIFFIGIDLSSVKIKKITFGYLVIPLVCMVSLIISASIFSFFTEKKFFELMVYGSGFGWFSMSGPLVSKILGTQAGAFTLLVDLIREFYAIGLLYLFGEKQARSSIGVCGATAMDSTLPFIKKNCSSDDVQLAIFVGFTLTILAPFFIIIFSLFL